MIYLNISAYKFINLPSNELAPLREEIEKEAIAQNIKGTILLSTEGINLFIAGEPDATQLFTSYLQTIPAFSDLWIKITESEAIPFQRLKVRIKEEIIFMNQPDIHPIDQTAPYLEPEQLKAWCQQNKDMVLLDTRNLYEFEAGTFEQAIPCDIEQFSEFPKAVSTLPEDFKNKCIVTFCTGGIRCEKASAYLMQQGFQNVWQLKGGILNYFEQCKGEYFKGGCFVFDDRRVVQP